MGILALKMPKLIMKLEIENIGKPLAFSLYESWGHFHKQFFRRARRFALYTNLYA